MHITIIGTGFVGVVSAAVYANLGYEVTGLDIDPKRVASLQKGKVPFFEPDLEELLLKTQKKGNLTFTTSYEKAITEADIIMIAVGTPSAPDGQADLTYVHSSAESMAPYLKEGVIVAVKSTVPPGTCDSVREKIMNVNPNLKSLYVVSLPEFLREGSAVADTSHPDRVIIGANEPEAISILKELHAPLCKNILVMKPESAQMAKYASNSYLATRITFINQIANLCEANGANILEVIKGIGQDKRIGSHYWYPGLGYGGSCFPKDVKELAAYARAVGQEDNLMVTISELNEDRIHRLFQRFGKRVGRWQNKKVTILGLSFKPNTDDMREAPSTKLIPLLLHAGATVTGYDPLAMEAASKIFGKSIHYAKDAYSACKSSDVIILLVEWPELLSLDINRIATDAPNSHWIDIRDQYDKDSILSVGMQYTGVGIQ